MAYRVGDVVNGHRLGEDNQWHAVEATGSEEGSSTVGQSTEPSPDGASPDGSLSAPPDGAGPKPWYQRQEVIAAAAILVVALVVGLFLRGGDDVATTAASTEPSATAPPAPATSAAPVAPAPAAPPTAATPAPATSRAPTRAPVVSSAPLRTPSAAAPSAPAVPTPAAPAPAAPPAVAGAVGLNTAVRDGAFEFTVSGVKCGQSQVGSDFLNKLAQGQFCLVSMAVYNTGTQAQVFDGAHQKALESQGRTVPADTEAGWYIEESKSFLEPVTPGGKVQGAIVFDIPKTSTITEVHLHHTASSSGAKVKVS